MSRPSKRNPFSFKLHYAERLLAGYYDTSHPLEKLPSRRSPLSSPRTARSGTREKKIFFGGILNNRKDPSRKEEKREGAITMREAGRGTAKFVPVQKTRESIADTFQIHPYESDRHLLLPTPSVSPGLSSEPEFTELLLGPKKQRNRVKGSVRPQTKWGMMRRLRGELENERNSVVRVEELFASPSGECFRIHSPMTIQRCTPASQFLDHMIRSQAFRKYIKPPIRSEVHIPRVRPPASCLTIETRKASEEPSERYYISIPTPPLIPTDIQ